MTTPQDAGIFAEGLGKRYGDLWALRDVDLAVPQGTVLGLLGHNGAGKTTAVRILTTLLQPTEGRARVAGLDVVAEAATVRTRIGLAGQQATVDGLLTGRANLEMVGRLYHLPRAAARARAEELLERLDLTDAADRLVRTFSGGMRRRLDLAASLVATPPVLFLDEPTTGLDPRSRIELWALLRELVRDGATMLLTTQYLEEADRLADDIVVLDGGRVVAQGAPAELKARVGGERLEVTVGSASELAAAAAALTPVRQRSALRRRRGVARRRAGPPRRAARRGRTRARRRRRRHHRPAPPRGDARRRLPRPHRTCRDDHGGRRLMTALAANLRFGVSDSLVLARRNLSHVRQIPEKLIDVTVQPLMFVILFAYVFGGAIAVPGGNYHEYLMGGIFIQTLVFGVMGPATSMANDLGEGVLDRFRSLPMARSAFLVGHVLAEFAAAMLGVAVMTAAGLIVGWRIHTDVPHAAAGFALIVLVAFTMLWVGMLLGTVARSADAVTGIVFIVIFPLTFVANAFVPAGTLPGVLQTVAEWNPSARWRPACARCSATRPRRRPTPRGRSSTPWPARSCGARRCWR